MRIERLVYLVALLTFATFACASGSVSRTFNTKEFTGLISVNSGYLDATLDYELDGAKGRVVHFGNCRQVEATTEQEIESSQYSLFKLLSINCLALKRYSESGAARRSFFPARFTRKLVAAFPATAVPRISDEEMKLRSGKTLFAYEKNLRISIAADGSARVVTNDDEIAYVPMARADFDGDGVEDVLVRVDWHARKAFGEGSDLLLLSKDSASGAVVVAWRALALHPLTTDQAR
jgi:hypothetical protein